MQEEFHIHTISFNIYKDITHTWWWCTLIYFRYFRINIITTIWKYSSPFSSFSYFWLVYLELKLQSRDQLYFWFGFFCSFLIVTNFNNCFEWIYFQFFSYLIHYLAWFLLKTTISCGECFKKKNVSMQRTTFICLYSKDSRNRPETLLWIGHTWNKKQRRQNSAVVISSNPYGDKSCSIPSQTKLPTPWVFLEQF